ncbi:MAG: hypothetical protein K2K97_02365 [Muribaculaceae bacterium]|nr:hypothetical protein [Muribaculaceae bacterium]
MKKLIYVAIAAVAMPSIMACSSQKKIAEEQPLPSPETYIRNDRMRNSRPVTAIPMATAFKMNGDYADNVAVTLNANGTLAYYPAPSDISEYSRPVDLGQGWWLNRQGISANSVFTRYTFAEYAKLKTVPTQKELLASIIPGSAVTHMEELPFTINDTPANLDSIQHYLATPHREPSIMRPKR